MFRMVSLIGLGVAILAAIIAVIIKPKSSTSCSTGRDHLLVGLVKKLAIIFGVLSALVLIGTGFANRLVFDGMIEGYVLMLHATAAPVFMACVAAIAVLFAGSAGLSRADCGILSMIVGEKVQDEKIETCICKRIGFWVILILTVPVILSIILSMLPIFGTHMQEVLFEIHRWCALLLAMTIIVEVAITGKSCKS